MKKVSASIITIGDELLIGQVIDTNSAFIASELNNIGVWMNHRIAVGDVWADIWEALEESAKMSDIILITGGLGPTADDITKPLLNSYFGGMLKVDEDALENVRTIFNATNRPLLDSNIKQAQVPDVCTVIQNTRGTAPGMAFNKNGKIFISMPGVPHEMKEMMKGYVLPYIVQNYSLPVILHKNLTTLNVGESFLAERLKNYEAKLPANVKLAYLPSVRSVRLRLTATGDDLQETLILIESFFQSLQKEIEDVVVTINGATLAEAVADLLKSKNKTVSTAESCTGGALASVLTEKAGSSVFFTGSVVAYSNEIKENILQVNKGDIEKFGAISEQVVRQMAINVRKISESDYSIATSGILGPDAVEGKKVGEVWIAVADEKGSQVQQFNFPYDRSRNREACIKCALNMLRERIIKI